MAKYPRARALLNVLSQFSVYSSRMSFTAVVQVSDVLFSRTKGLDFIVGKGFVWVSIIFA